MLLGARLAVTTLTEPEAAASLPESYEWRPLPPVARWVYSLDTAIGSAVFAGLLIAVLVVFSLAQDWPVYPVAYASAFLGYAALGFGRGYLRWKHTLWRLDETGFRITRGWLWQSETLVPRVRVQHLDIDRGPIERRYDLATLTVYTAGTTNSAVALGSLAHADAQALRDALLPAARADVDTL